MNEFDLVYRSLLFFLYAFCNETSPQLQIMLNFMISKKKYRKNMLQCRLEVLLPARTYRLIIIEANLHGMVAVGNCAFLRPIS